MVCPACGLENPPRAKFCNECGAGLNPADSPAKTLENRQDWGSGFVGRHREMVQLLSALGDARSGRGRMVMLVGEPGIGKTRTSQELAIHARSSGCTVLWGRCYEEGGTPPYWPWVQALNPYIGATPSEHLREELGGGASEIAEIVPRVRDSLPNLEPPQFQDPDQARFRLFSSLSTFLKNVARSQPLLVVLDDLHWADSSTLQFLEFLARELPDSPLMILGTYRDMEVSRRHPLSQTLGSLMRERGFLRLQLTGLNQPEVERLIRDSVDGVPPPGLLSTVHQRTEGNPLFVGEIARMLIREDHGDGLTLPAVLPEGIRDAIGRRLNRLSESCNQVLTLASVIGREFDPNQLGLMADDLTGEEVQEALEEAESARVIEEVPGSVGRYQFSHALIQETLVEELSLNRRVQLHATITQALESLYSDDLESHAAELAYHSAEAQSVLGVEKLVRYSLMAGEQALAAYAWEAAIVHFERGMVARGVSWQGAEPLPDAESAELMFGLGRAQAATYLTGQHQGLLSSLERAFDYYFEAGEVDNAVAVAACHLPAIYGRLQGAAERVLTALRLVPADSLEAGRLLSQFIRLRGGEKDGYAGAKTALADVLTIAQRLGDQGLELRARASFAVTSQFHPEIDMGLEQSLKAIDLARQVDDPHSEIYARLGASHLYLFKGEPDQAQRQGYAALAAADRLGDRFWRNGSQYRLLTVALALGQWEKGRELGRMGLLLDETDRRILGGLIRLEYEVGDFELGETYLNRLLRTGQGPSQDSYFGNAVVGLLIPMAYRGTSRMFQLDTAESSIDAVISSDYVMPRFESLARSGLGLLAAERSDGALASAQYAAVMPYQHNMTLFALAVDRVLGLLAHTMGKQDVAAQHFEDSLSFCRRAGYRPELAWTCCDYSDTLLQRNEAGDRERAMSLLEESLAISNELGMRPLMERVQSRLESLGSSAAEPAYPDGLTQREVEVLRLITLGMSNRDIGDGLVITESTVRRHVSNIYAKIGVGNRTEAARYALREGFVTED